MKVILTIWNGRIAPVFDVAGRAVLLEIDVNNKTERKEFILPEGGGVEKLSFIKGLQPDIFVCGAVSQRVFQDIQTMETEVHTFVSGCIDEVLEALNKGTLDQEEFIMPGCKRGFCRRRGAGTRGAWVVSEEKRR